MENQKFVIGLLVGLVVGGPGGYLLGSYLAMQSINEQPTAQEAENAASQTNALGDVQTNPYESVRLNPFD